jgi:bifunctional DNase/RNase
MSTTSEPTWVEADIVEIRRSEEGDPLRRPHVVVLQERGGTRRLPIYTGAPEAIALACTLEAVEMPRPMTYQLAANLLGAAKSQVSSVRITRLAESTFYAVVAVEGPGGPAEVDARPSDALNLALVCGAPILIQGALLDDPECTRHTAWEQYPTGAAQLVAEVRERQADLLKLLSEQSKEGA